jgi:endonuclease-3 related protein
MLTKIYSTLLESLGPQRWWPIRGSFSPGEWEVCLGAVLTQNTSWKNVEKALENLRASNILSKEDIIQTPQETLTKIIRPAGYFNQKARKLKELASFTGEPTRESLLSLWGIGKETADSILLYAYNKPYFVIDAYTRRVFSRLGLIKGDEEYDELRLLFESSIPREVKVYKEYHALIVNLGKNVCKKEPLCEDCPVSGICSFKKAKL